MGTRTRIRNTVGLVALGASLALASLGVNTVRAEPQGRTADAAPIRSAECPVPGTAAPAAPGTDAFVGQLRREHASPYRKVGNRPDGEWVVLNTRGYNYGPPRGTAPGPAPAEDPRR